MRTIVVGAGVFGLTAALELARRGHPITVLDPGPLPRREAASTDSSRAVRADYGGDALYTDLALEAMARWPSFAGGGLYREVGMLFLTRGAMQPASFELQSYRALTARGCRPERLDGGALGRRFPAWAGAPYRDGYLSPRAGWVDAGATMAALLGEARAAGVEVRQGELAVAVETTAARVRAVVTASGRRYDADAAVVAAGAWTPRLLPELADRLRAVAQPVLYLAPADPTPFAGAAFPPFAADIATSGWYGFPAGRGGLVKVANHGPGLARDPDAPRQVPPDFEAAVRAFLRDALPAHPELAEAPCAEARLCFYTDTTDGDFWISRCPHLEGLAVATGGSGHAFKFAPVLGAITADVVLGVPNARAARFAWREAGPVRREAARGGG